jgi:hypothetical protein
MDGLRFGSLALCQNLQRTTMHMQSFDLLIGYSQEVGSGHQKNQEQHFTWLRSIACQYSIVARAETHASRVFVSASHHPPALPL